MSTSYGIEQLLPILTDQHYGVPLLDLCRHVLKRPDGKPTKQSPGTQSKKYIHKTQISTLLDCLYERTADVLDYSRKPDADALSKRWAKFCEMLDSFFELAGNQSFIESTIDHFIVMLEESIAGFSQLQSVTDDYLEAIQNPNNDDQIQRCKQKWYATYNMLHRYFHSNQCNRPNTLTEMLTQIGQVVRTRYPHSVTNDDLFTHLHRQMPQQNIDTVSGHDAEVVLLNPSSLQLRAWVHQGAYTKLWPDNPSDKHLAKHDIIQACLKLYASPFFIQQSDLLEQFNDIRTRVFSDNAKAYIDNYTKLIYIQIELSRLPNAPSHLSEALQDFRQALKVMTPQNKIDALTEVESFLLSTHHALQAVVHQYDEGADFRDWVGELYRTYFSEHQCLFNDGTKTPRSDRDSGSGPEADTALVCDHINTKSWVNLFETIASRYKTESDRGNDVSGLLTPLACITDKLIEHPDISFGQRMKLLENYPTTLGFWSWLVDRDNTLPDSFMASLLEEYQTEDCAHQIRCIELLVNREKACGVIIPEIQRAIRGLSSTGLNKKQTQHLNEIITSHNEFIATRQVNWFVRCIRWIINFVMGRHQDYINIGMIKNPQTHQGQLMYPEGSSESLDNAPNQEIIRKTDNTNKRTRNEFFRKIAKIDGDNGRIITRLLTCKVELSQTENPSTLSDLSRDNIMTVIENKILPDQALSSRLSPAALQTLRHVVTTTQIQVIEREKLNIILRGENNQNLANFYKLFCGTLSEALVTAKLAASGRFKVTNTDSANTALNLIKIGSLFLPSLIVSLLSATSMLIDNVDQKRQKSRDKKIAKLTLSLKDAERFAEKLALEFTYRFRAHIVSLHPRSVKKAFRYVLYKSLAILLSDRNIMPKEYDIPLAVENMFQALVSPMPLSQVEHSDIRNTMRENKQLTYLDENNQEFQWGTDDVLTRSYIKGPNGIYPSPYSKNNDLDRFSVREGSDYEISHLTTIPFWIKPTQPTSMMQLMDTLHAEPTPQISLSSPTRSPGKSVAMRLFAPSKLSNMYEALVKLFGTMPSNELIEACRVKLKHYNLSALTVPEFAKKLKCLIQKLKREYRSDRSGFRLHTRTVNTDDDYSPTISRSGTGSKETESDSEGAEATDAMNIVSSHAANPLSSLINQLHLPEDISVKQLLQLCAKLTTTYSQLESDDLTTITSLVVLSGLYLSTQNSDDLEEAIINFNNKLNFSNFGLIPMPSKQAMLEANLRESVYLSPQKH